MEKVILGSFQASQPHLQVVLAHLTSNPVTEYVTWIYNKSMNSYSYGNYYHTLENASANFLKRCVEYQENGDNILEIFLKTENVSWTDWIKWYLDACAELDVEATFEGFKEHMEQKFGEGSK